MEAESYTEEIPLVIPPPLKTHLEDDCFWIVRRSRLVRLPRKPSVETILREYYSHCSAGATDETNLSLLAEVLDGIKIYFDFMMEDHLLFSQEKEQFKKLVKQSHSGFLQMNTSAEGKLQNDIGANSESHDNCHDPTSTMGVAKQPFIPSGVYGCEHLLRLFVRFPLFLSRAQLPVSHVYILHGYFKDFLGYICSKRHELFAEYHYEDTIPTELGLGLVPQPQPHP